MSILLATAASAWLAFSPCIYQESSYSAEPDIVELGPATHRTVLRVDSDCAGSLVTTDGTYVLLMLAIPVLLGGLGYVAASRSGTRLAWTAAFLLFAWCIVSSASIGLFYLPSAVALLAAAFVQHRRRERPPTASEAT